MLSPSMKILLGRRRTILVVAVVAAAAIVVVAGAWGIAYLRKSAYERGDYVAAFREWSALAEKGDVDAQYGLGLLYLEGKGTAKNHTEAARWFLKAAEQGHLEAQAKVGILYGRGNEGLPLDKEKSFDWTRKAAERGHSSAQVRLGSLYQDGEGVSKDLVQAYKWFEIAAPRRPTEQTRDKAIRMRNEVAAGMAPAQVEEARRQAKEWKPSPG